MRVHTDEFVKLPLGTHVLSALCYDPALNPSPKASAKVTVTREGADLGPDDEGKNLAHLMAGSITLEKTQPPNITLQDGLGHIDEFKQADTDNSGELEFKEWKQVFNPNMPDDELHKIFEKVDLDHNGAISIGEYIAYMNSVPGQSVTPLSQEVRTKVSPITGETHEYTVDTIVMTEAGLYAFIDCPDERAVMHYTVNIPELDIHAPTVPDHLVKLNYGVNYVRALCYNPEMTVSDMSSLEVFVVPPGECLPGETGVQPNCVKCAAGKYKRDSGSALCIQCTEGMTSPEGSTTDSKCSCAAGWTKGDVKCIQCDAGKYKPDPGNAVCLDCPAASVSQAGATSADECVCGPGFTPGADGSCVACAEGTYKDAAGSQACTACPANSHSPQQGSKYESDCSCAPGYAGHELPYIANSDGTFTQITSPDPSNFPNYAAVGEELCIACPPGTYKDTAGGFGASACTSCPENMVAPEASASSGACQCIAGYSGPDATGPCLACPPGTFKAVVGSAECAACQGGEAAARGSIACSDECGPGYTQGPDKSCVACEAGTYKPSPGSHACTACPDHMTSAIASSTGPGDCKCEAGHTGPDGGPCSLCPFGTYKDAVGSAGHLLARFLALATVCCPTAIAPCLVHALWRPGAALYLVVGATQASGMPGTANVRRAMKMMSLQRM